MHKSISRWNTAFMLLLALSIGNLWAQGDIRWNVLFFMSDMHSPHFMSVDNQDPQNVFTPNLDRLAKEGMIFDKAFCAYPVCAPTRASIITGEYPQKHGEIANDKYLVEAGPDGKTPSLGHLFKTEGYNTALIGKTHSNMQLWDASPTLLYEGKSLFFGFDYRLERNEGTPHPSVPEHIPSDAVWNSKQTLYLTKCIETFTGVPKPSWEQAVWATAFDPPFRSGATGKIAYTIDGITYFDAVEYLDQYAKGKPNSEFKINNPSAPFLLYVSMLKPHEPWESPNMHDSIDFYAMYSGRPEDDTGHYRYKNEIRKKIVPLELTPEELAFDMEGWPTYGSTYRTSVSSEVWRLARARYSSCASWVDHLLGKTMERLDRLDDPNNPGKKLSETTILIYTSDHGDMLGEKYREGKMVMQEASARVPFLIRMPGVVPAGVRSNILINHVDMLPTIAGLCGLGSKLRTGLAGKDLSASVKQNNASLGPAHTYTVCNLNSDSKVHPGKVMGRSQQFKFIRFSQKQANGLPYMVLFDMDNDPHETKNLADDPKYAAIVNRESAAMDTFLLSFGVPPVNLRLTVSTRFSTATPGSARDLEVVSGNGRISFIPGRNLRDQNSVVDISIHSPNGALLKRISFESKCGKGYSWDLRSGATPRVKSNLYLYRFTFKNGEGHQISETGKLIWAEK